LQEQPSQHLWRKLKLLVLVKSRLKAYRFEVPGKPSDRSLIFMGSISFLYWNVASLGSLIPVADGNGNHHRHPFPGNQIVQRREQRLVGSVRPDNKRRGRAGDVLFRDIHRDPASVGRWMAGSHDQSGGIGGIGGIGRTEGAGVTCDAGAGAWATAGTKLINRPIRKAMLGRRKIGNSLAILTQPSLRRWPES
jgi:hypothetical protein